MISINVLLRPWESHTPFLQIQLKKLDHTNTNTHSSSDPHISAGDEAFALHVAGPEEFFGLVQKGDLTPAGAPPPWAQSIHLALLLLHVCHSLFLTHSSTVWWSESSMYFGISEGWKQTSGALYCLCILCSGALTVAMTTEAGSGMTR